MNRVFRVDALLHLALFQRPTRVHLTWRGDLYASSFFTHALQRAALSRQNVFQASQDTDPGRDESNITWGSLGANLPYERLSAAWFGAVHSREERKMISGSCSWDFFPQPQNYMKQTTKIQGLLAQCCVVANIKDCLLWTSLAQALRSLQQRLLLLSLAGLLLLTKTSRG